jgi:hypothetical protein
MPMMLQDFVQDEWWAEIPREQGRVPMGGFSQAQIIKT